MSNSSREFALADTINRLEFALKPRLPWDGDVTEGGIYHDGLPLPIPEFLTGLESASWFLNTRNGEIKNWKFLDVGCALGTKMLIARSLGWEVAGIERIYAYARQARYLTQSEDVFLGDALHFIDWDKYDLIYMYKPIRDNALMSKLIMAAVEGAKDGTMFFLPMCEVPTEANILPAGRNLYVKLDK